jgi:hypothetical protein
MWRGLLIGSTLALMGFTIVAVFVNNGQAWMGAVFCSVVFLVSYFQCWSGAMQRRDPASGIPEDVEAEGA